MIPYELRTVDELGECFDGLEMVPPGLVSITQWRPETVGATGEPPDPIEVYGGMGRKP